MTKIPNKLQVWVEAQRKYRLSDTQVQMARELGMNPQKLGNWQTINKNPGKHLSLSSSRSVIGSVSVNLHQTKYYLLGSTLTARNNAKNKYTRMRLAILIHKNRLSDPAITFLFKSNPAFLVQ